MTYAIDRADQFDALFGHLKIAQAPTPGRNDYFVMTWNFSEIEPTEDLDAIRAAVHQHINGCIEAFIVRFQDRLAHRIAVHPTNAIRSFQSVLAAVSQSPHRLYLFIDEYDNFADVVTSPRSDGEV